MPEIIRIGKYFISTALPELPSPAPLASRPFVINTINTHSWVVAERDELFREALAASDILLPDGEGIVWAVKYLTGKKIRKIAGYDVFIHLLEYLQRTSGTCFFTGGSPHTLDLIKGKLSKEYPSVRAGFYSPPFRTEFDENDNAMIYYELRKTIDEFNSGISNYESSSSNLQIPLSSNHHHNSSSLNVLFVGMTAPKQEKWVFQNQEKIRADIICSIGAVFDFYAGTAERPHGWMIRLRLEWLGRLLTDPKKIWKRVFLSGPRFIFSIVTSPRQ
jgi:N-acetylglucosaminyldiphosphoundecaprenol N-acetyl-beta-D-mannosaminyltransferase